jgi:hypothetical protein
MNKDIGLTVRSVSDRQISDKYSIVNAVIQVNKPFYANTLQKHTELWHEQTVVTNIEKYEEYYKNLNYLEDPKTGAYYPVNCSDFNEQDFYKRAYVLGDPFLDYIPKFDVYWFRATVFRNTATDGLIKYLNELYQIKDLDVFEFYELLITLQSLNHFA